MRPRPWLADRVHADPSSLTALILLCVQQDMHAVHLDLQSEGQASTALFAVFDGHGGSEVAKFCAEAVVSEGGTRPVSTACSESLMMHTNTGTCTALR